MTISQYFTEFEEITGIDLHISMRFKLTVKVNSMSLYEAIGKSFLEVIVGSKDKIIDYPSLLKAREGILKSLEELLGG